MRDVLIFDLRSIYLSSYEGTNSIIAKTGSSYISANSRNLSTSNGSSLNNENFTFSTAGYLQHEHYALWEVIEFGDSYKALPDETAKYKGPAGEVSSSTKKKGRTMAITAEEMQKRKNDVKARNNLLLALPDEHQLRFSKYDSAKELWEAILKTFGENKATKKTKKNQLKQQYGASTASAQVPTVSTDVAAASLSYDIVCAFIATQEDEASTNHALVADKEEVPTEYALMEKSSSSSDNEKCKVFNSGKLLSNVDISNGKT
nr:hypothetical protein [Tanacetum cinerariifolium]